jgi:hypothetical protein
MEGLTFGLSLKEGDLLRERAGGLFGPMWFEVGQQFAWLFVAEKKAGEEAVFYGEALHGMAQPIKAIHKGAERFAVAGAHKFIQPEIVFEPDMQGHIAFVGLDDLGGVAELVIENHGICQASSMGMLKFQ